MDNNQGDTQANTDITIGGQLLPTVKLSIAEASYMLCLSQKYFPIAVRQLNLKIVNDDKNIFCLTEDISDALGCPNLPMHPERFRTLKEISYHLGLPRDKVREMCQRKMIPHYKFKSTKNSQILFIIQEVDAFFAEHGSQDIILARTDPSGFYHRVKEYRRIVFGLLELAVQHEIITEEVLNKGDLIKSDMVVNLFDHLLSDKTDLEAENMALHQEISLLKAHLANPNYVSGSMYLSGNNQVSLGANKTTLSIRDLYLPTKIEIMLETAGIKIVGELIAMTSAQVLNLPGFTSRYLTLLNKCLFKEGVCLLGDHLPLKK